MILDRFLNCPKCGQIMYSFDHMLWEAELKYICSDEESFMAPSTTMY